MALVIGTICGDDKYLIRMKIRRTFNPCGNTHARSAKRAVRLRAHVHTPELARIKRVSIMRITDLGSYLVNKGS